MDAFQDGSSEKKVMNRPLKCERPSQRNYRVFVKCQDFEIIKLLWIGSGNYDGWKKHSRMAVLHQHSGLSLLAVVWPELDRMASEVDLSQLGHSHCMFSSGKVVNSGCLDQGVSGGGSEVCSGVGLGTDFVFTSMWVLPSCILLWNLPVLA